MRHFFLILIFLVPSLCSAQYFHLNQTCDEIPICREITYLRDPGHELVVEQLTEPSLAEQFTTHGKSVINFKITNDVLWIRSNFICDESGTYFYRVSPPLIDSLTFYSYEKGSWRVQQGGYKSWNAVREISGPCWIFSFHAEAGDTVETYLRTETKMPMVIQMNVGGAPPVLEVVEERTMLSGIYIGFMLLMILYNMFLFITNRQPVYLHYSLYTLFAGLFVSLASGAALMYPTWLWRLHSLSLALIPSLFGIFGMTFTREFLITKKYFPNFRRWIIILTTAVFVNVILDFVDRIYSGTMIQLVGGVFSLLVIYSGVRVLRAGYKPAIYYVLGVATYMVFLLAYIFFGVAEVELGSFQPFYLLMFGSAIEAVILSFAIGDKLNSANRLKQEADEAKLLAIQENERIVREQNVVLEQKVVERTSEINEQKEIIQEKNKDILDSIYYAKRIQSALLAPAALMNKYLTDHFVLYLPKDIVSGDFYFAAESHSGKFVLCVGDCTGHGVPGAFMSLLNISILRELITEQKLERPDLLLNRQREQIIKALNPDGAQDMSKDGMDCVVASFDFVTRKVEFACANNPIWILRDNTLREFKPDKQPIGVYEGEYKPFTLHCWEGKPGDIIYLFTDGLADQFGGPRGKKFKYQQLNQILSKNGSSAMKDQLVVLQREFENWKGRLEQVDDVLVLGIRLS